MNYLKIILSFWQLRRSKRITSLQADLYFFLIQESSSRGEGLDWENPFECANKLICAGIGISEDAIIDARNRLKQLGLIDFMPGERNKKSPVYEIFYPFKTENIAVKVAGNNTGKPAGKHPNLKKEYHNVTKQNSSVTNVTGDGGTGIQDDPKNLQPERKKGSAQKKKEEPPMEFWAALVAVWFEVNKEKYNGFEPDFDKQDPKHLKDIVTRLKNRAGKQKIDWTEANAVDRLRKYFNHAYQDPWLKTNFLLSNLSKQLEKFEKNESGGITTAAGDGTGSNGRSGQSAGTARGRGGSISDIQNAKRPGTANNPEREEFTPIEVVK